MARRICGNGIRHARFRVETGEAIAAACRIRSRRIEKLNDIDFADGEIRILAINETSYPESLDPACSRRAQQGVVPMLFETEK